MHTIFLQSAGNVPTFTPGPFYDLAFPVHSLMRYVVLLFLGWAIVTANKARKNSSLEFTSVRRPAFFTILAIDIQLLLGIYLWIVRVMYVGGYSAEAKGGFMDKFSNLKRITKVDSERIVLLEHALIMFIALVIIHIGYAKAKRAATDQLKSKRIFVFYTIGLV
ncbi:MAG: hypothetical protein ACKVPJ_11335, partial [Chitinophagales bacterium]